MLSHAIVLASSMFDVSSRAKLSVSALAERKIASARPRKYGLLLRAEEEMLLYGQALARPAPARCGSAPMPPRHRAGRHRARGPRSLRPVFSHAAPAAPLHPRSKQSHLTR